MLSLAVGRIRPTASWRNIFAALLLLFLFNKKMPRTEIFLYRSLFLSEIRLHQECDLYTTIQRFFFSVEILFFLTENIRHPSWNILISYLRTNNKTLMDNKRWWTTNSETVKLEIQSPIDLLFWKLYLIFRKINFIIKLVDLENLPSSFETGRYLWNRILFVRKEQIGVL